MGNVGSIDRVVRLLAAAGLVAGASVAGPGSTVGIILFVLALVLALTGAVGFCPLYAPLKVNTCKRPSPGATGEAQPGAKA